MLHEHSINGNYFLKRELEILLLLSLGLSNEEIAKRLYVSKNTLRGYLNNIYRKIAAESRNKAILFAESHEDANSDLLKKNLPLEG